MVEIAPFRGWRFDLAQVGALDDVTAPPYDVIGPELQTTLYKRHPCNTVRLVLNRAEPGDREPADRQRRAADFWKHWRVDRILRQEHEESVYVAHQEFEWQGQRLTRRGVVVRMRLAELGQGDVDALEPAVLGPTTELIELLRGTRASLSPLLGLYQDPTQSIQHLLEDACLGLTPIETADDAGVRHRLWPVKDLAVINAIREMFRSQSVVLAEGRPQYEAACAYQREVAAAGGPPADFVMIQLVELSDRGLVVAPVHRLLSGLPGITGPELIARCGAACEFEPMGTGPEAAVATWEMMQADGSQQVFGLGTAADQQWTFARMVSPAMMAELAPTQSEAWRGLGVSAVERWLLPSVLPTARTGERRHVQTAEDAGAALAAKICDVACLVPPVGREALAAVPFAGEALPGQSTYFVPKLLSGLVFYGG